MKLAKQIILLSAALVLAMGIAFTCISGIVIGTQTSVKSVKLTEAITYDSKVHDANVKRDAAIKGADDQKVIDIAAAAEDADLINKANDKHSAAVKEAKRVRSVEVTTAKRNRDKAITTAKKDAYKAAFWYTSKTTHTDGGVINATATAEHQRLTPMALMLVSGLSMTFIGGGLVLTVVLLNKNEAKKAPAPKAAKAA